MHENPSHVPLAIRIVGKFLYSNLSMLLILLSLAVGAVALLVTPREEEPQIVVPLADVLVSYPGRSAQEVEQHVSTRLEKLLYQIDGVEYVYSMSRPGQSIVTVRFYVGQDREESLIKLYNKIQQNVDIVPEGVTGWVVKPVEIDDVPIVTFALTSATDDDAMLRRVAEELADRLQAVKNTAVTTVVGGRRREQRVDLRPEALAAYSVSISQVAQALRGANVAVRAGEFSRDDRQYVVDGGTFFRGVEELGALVVAVSNDRPVYLRDVAALNDGPADVSSYVRFGRGPAWGRIHGADAPAGTEIGAGSDEATEPRSDGGAIENRKSKIENASTPSVTIAVAKKKGTNAVWVARDVIRQAEELKRTVVPDSMQLVVTRNMGVTANHKVNELIEALGVAILIVIVLLTVAMGWRAALVVAVAVPIVFALTLFVNMLFGYTINRVTLFALILSLGLLVDDPIVDVENIHRHFQMRRKATRRIVLEAVNEIRPPLIAATIAVIISFLPMFFITGMMGPYMRPMALNVPVTMIMSMVVAFTITPWMAWHVLRRGHGGEGSGLGVQGSVPKDDEGRSSKPESTTKDEGRMTKAEEGSGLGVQGSVEQGPRPQIENRKSKIENPPNDHEVDVKNTLTYRVFRPLMEPLLRSRRIAWAFLGVVFLLLVATAAMPMLRMVPLKMLPFDNKNELQLVIDMPEGTTLERTSAAIAAFEEYLQTVPEVVAFESYCGVPSPMDFNGLVRHYYLRRAAHQGDIRIILADKRDRVQQSHALALRLRDDLTAIAALHDVNLKIVESPPGPPVISTIAAEVYGRPDHSSDDLRRAALLVAERLRREAGVVDVDTTVESEQTRIIFQVDRTKAALNGISSADLAETLAAALGGQVVTAAEAPTERNTLPIVLRLPEADRSSLEDLSRLYVSGSGGRVVPLAELGQWQRHVVDQTIYHKNLRPVQYVFAEMAGRAPAEAILDVEADRVKDVGEGSGFRVQGSVENDEARNRKPELMTNDEARNLPIANRKSQIANPRPVDSRTYFRNGGGIPWSLPDGIEVTFSGEGEWQITLDVFRDLGLAFLAAMAGIYILLVHETGSFLLPLVIMLAIPLTILGIMPGFWLLNLLTGQVVGGYGDPVFFTATAMIGMIALAGIVTRDAIILVDFIHHSLARGRTLVDAIMESRVVRLRPILLTAGAAMLGAWPITLDPIFSGLAWALIFGLFASTLFTLFVIPVSYWLLYEHKPGHGLPARQADLD